MSTAEPRRIFVSYAHRDGRELALQLRRDLQNLGFDVWLDTHRLIGGDVWAREIEVAIDRCDITLALLSTASYWSDICRAEQERSLAKQKIVIPIRVQQDCDVPLSLQTRQYINFSDPANYEMSVRQLEESIRERRGVGASVEDRVHYNNSPPLPENFVERPEILTALRDALFLEAPNRNIAITALQGMGGIGKTVLARALCHTEVVRHAYPDGIFWFRIGRESKLRFDQRIDNVPGLKLLMGSYDCEEACVSQYRNVFRDKAALIVLDDVWRAGDIEPFRTESPRSRLLVTTRDTGIAPAFGAREFTAELPSAGEAREVLSRWAGLESGRLPSLAGEVIEECQNLPLALALIGAQLKGKGTAHWSIVLNHLRRANLNQIGARFPEPHNTLFRAIHISFEALRDENPLAAQRYLALAVMLEDMTIAVPIQQTLWNVNEMDALETSDRFIGLSLAQRDGPHGGIRLHDLQLDYVRALNTNPKTLELIRWAVRLSIHVIVKDPHQFASQVVGRLLPHRDATAIRKFTEEISAWAPKPWLRPLNPALQASGTALLRTLKGHSDAVNCVAVTPGGKRVISASSDQTLRLWDLETGRTVRTLQGHSSGVTSVVVTPDGKRAVSASWDRTLIVWELETGQALRRLEGHAEGIYCVALTPDGKRAVSASRDQHLLVWDLETGDPFQALAGHSADVMAVAVTPDGKRAVSASRDHTLIMWELETGRPLHTLKGHSNTVSGVAVTRDGKWAVSASSDYTIRVWDLGTGSLMRTLVDRFSIFSAANGVAIMPDGKRAVIASRDHTAKLCDLETGDGLGVLQGHSSEVYCVAITPDGKAAISSSADGTLKVWNLEAGAALPKGHKAAICALAVAPNAKRAISASWDSTLKVWDLETGTDIQTLVGHASNMVMGVGVTSDGKRAVSGGWDNTVRVWNVVTGRAQHVLTGHWGIVYGVAVTPDGKRAVCACQRNILTVWNLASWRTRVLGTPLRTLEGHSDEVVGVAVTPQGRSAISGSRDKTLRMWDLDTGRTLLIMEGHSDDVVGVAVTPDGKRAVSASHDKTLKVWDLHTGRALLTLEGHTDSVKGVAVTLDGKRAVSASQDETLKVWDLDTGIPVITFYCDGPVWSCALVNNECVVAGDRGGRVYILAVEEERTTIPST